jgi:hypothetical protein
LKRIGVEPISFSAKLLRAMNEVLESHRESVVGSREVAFEVAFVQGKVCVEESIQRALDFMRISDLNKRNKIEDAAKKFYWRMIDKKRALSEANMGGKHEEQLLTAFEKCFPVKKDAWRFLARVSASNKKLMAFAREVNRLYSKS